MVDLFGPDLVNSVDLADSVLNSVFQLWDLIETWGFPKDIKGTGPDSVDLADSVLKSVSQLWDLIET